MDEVEDPGLGDQYRTASPWPLFVALGVPISEVGLLFDLFPVAVGGLVLFCGSAAGMAEDAGYVDAPWPALAVLAACCLALGAGLALLAGQVTQGAATSVAGVLLLLVAVGVLFVDDEPTPL